MIAKFKSALEPQSTIDQYFDPPLENVISLTISSVSIDSTKVMAPVEWKNIQVYSPNNHNHTYNSTIINDLKYNPSNFNDDDILYEKEYDQILLEVSSNNPIKAPTKGDGAKKSGNGILTMIIVTDLSHTLTTLLTKLITDEFTKDIVPVLQNSVESTIEKPLTGKLVGTLGPLLKKR